METIIAIKDSLIIVIKFECKNEAEVVHQYIQDTDLVVHRMHHQQIHHRQVARQTNRMIKNGNDIRKQQRHHQQLNVQKMIHIRIQKRNQKINQNMLTTNFDIKITEQLFSFFFFFRFFF